MVAKRLQRPPVQSGAALCDRFRPCRARGDPFAQLLPFVCRKRRSRWHFVGRNSSDQQTSGGIARRKRRSPRASLERAGAGGKIQLALLGARAVALDAAPLQDPRRSLSWRIRRGVEGRAVEECRGEQHSRHGRSVSSREAWKSVRIEIRPKRVPELTGACHLLPRPAVSLTGKLSARSGWSQEFPELSEVARQWGGLGAARVRCGCETPAKQLRSHERIGPIRLVKHDCVQP